MERTHRPIGKPAPDDRLRRILVIVVLAAFFLLLIPVVAPFVAAMVWALILSVSFWPLYRRVRRKLPRPDWFAPGVLTAIITLGLAIPLIIVGIFLTEEIAGLFATIKEVLTTEKGDQVVEELKGFPLVGKWLSDGLESLRLDPKRLEDILAQNSAFLFNLVQGVVSGIVGSLFTIAVCIFGVFFCFRDGERLAEQFRRAGRRLGGDRMQEIMKDMRETVRGVVYGLVMTAIVQAILAAFGFWVAGVPYPLLLGGLTLIMAFIPYGVVMVWMPASISLMVQQNLLWGVLLFMWGMCVISTMDNFLRPIFIGQATQMPIFLVFVGVLGGLFAFGLMGLFVGPVLMAVLLTLWRGWISTEEEATGGETAEAAA